MKTETLFLERLHWVPNNPTFPVVLHRNALPSHARNRAAAFEQMFTGNGWPSQWRNGIYDFDHYHLHAHEVLGIAEGHAQVVLGGPGGPSIAVEAGDALILPAGTGHRLASGSDDLLVVGAYPPGQHPDICRDAPDPADVEQLSVLDFPALDPVAGADGPLTRLWSRPDKGPVP